MAASGENEGEEDATAAGEEFSNQRTEEQAELLKRGAGEEEEVTRFELHIKLYRLNDGKVTDLGKGTIKVNQTEGDIKKQRLLVRQDGTGTVTLNSKINEHVTCTIVGAKNRDVNLFTLGLDSNGTPGIMRYTARCQDTPAAEALKAAIEKAKDEVGPVEA
jgi:hypothetical protein